MAIAVTDPVTGTGGRVVSSVSVTFSATPSDGELIVLCLGLRDGSASADGTSNAGTPPSGFTAGPAIVMSSASSFARHAQIWWRVASSEASATYSFTSFTTTSGVYVKKTLVGLRITGITNPQAEDPQTSEDTSTSFTSVATGTCDPTIANSVFVALIVAGKDATGGVGVSSWDNSLVEKADFSVSGAGPDHTQGVATLIVTDGSAQSTVANLDDTYDDGSLDCIVAFSEGAGVSKQELLQIPHHQRGGFDPMHGGFSA